MNEIPIGNCFAVSWLSLTHFLSSSSQVPMNFLERHMSALEVLVILALIACRILFKYRPFRTLDKSPGAHGRGGGDVEKVPFLDISNQTNASSGASNRRNAREDREKTARSRNESPVSIMVGDV